MAHWRVKHFFILWKGFHEIRARWCVVEIHVAFQRSLSIEPIKKSLDSFIFTIQAEGLVHLPAKEKRTVTGWGRKRPILRVQRVLQSRLIACSSPKVIPVYLTRPPLTLVPYFSFLLCSPYSLALFFIVLLFNSFAGRFTVCETFFLPKARPSALNFFYDQTFLQVSVHYHPHKANQRECGEYPGLSHHISRRKGRYIAYTYVISSRTRSPGP